MSDIIRLEATIHGIVQGVFFRYHTKLEADRLGVSGTVRNCCDGTVSVVAEGSRDRLEQLLNWLHHGPQLAVVEHIDLSWGPAGGGAQSFHIEH